MAAEALRRSEYRLAEVESTARLGSWEWDIAADRLTWSEELCNLFGVGGTDFVSTYCEYLDHLHPEDQELAHSAIAMALETRGEFSVDHRVLRADGAVVWFQSRGRVELGADGVPARMWATAADITERITLQQELSALALFDDLTGLHNRRGFVTLAEHQFKVAARAERAMPLLFLDMDGMKSINDTYGHKEGDRALIEVSKFLRSVLRGSDLVARLGGDEFCVLMIDDGSGSAPDIDRVVAALRSGPPGRRPYPLCLSVGVAWLKPGSGTSVEDLVSRADGAMYEDKSCQRRLADVLGVEAADERDEVGQQRDQAADERDEVGQRRDRAADERDAVGQRRDQAADERDSVGQRRDQAADERDSVEYKQSQAWVGAGVTEAVLNRSARGRQEAAADRRRAAEDRRAGAGDRNEAEHDRDTASSDRGAGAGERNEAEHDRDTASSDRGAGAGERNEAEHDRVTASSDRGAGAGERNEAEHDRVTASAGRGAAAGEAARRIRFRR